MEGEVYSNDSLVVRQASGGVVHLYSAVTGQLLASTGKATTQHEEVVVKRRDAVSSMVATGQLPKEWKLKAWMLR